MKPSQSSNSVNVAIGAAVRVQRNLLHKSVGQAAEALCISQALYLMCEAGEVPFQASDLFTLADFFGVRSRDLMPSEEELKHIDAVTRYGDPQEVRDLIYYFSGIVSPALRRFFLKQIEDASIQGERGAVSVLTPSVKPAPAMRRQPA